MFIWIWAAWRLIQSNTNDIAPDSIYGKREFGDFPADFRGAAHVNFQIGGHLLIEEISDLLDTSHIERDEVFETCKRSSFIFL